MPNLTVDEVKAIVQNALQSFVGQGIGSALFVVKMTQPGGVSTQPHRDNAIAISGWYDGGNAVKVLAVASNPVNQKGLGGYTKAKPSVAPAAVAAPAPSAAPPDA